MVYSQNDAVLLQTYKIGAITYNIIGATNEYPLSQAVKIDTDKIFATKEQIEEYLLDIQTQLQNQRILESASLEAVYHEADSKNIILVDLYISTKDTWNIIIFPYPKFDSNTGFEFKLKIKNYNFLGSMRELNSDIIYKLNDKNEHRIGGNISLSVPFDFSFMILTTDFSAGLDWAIGNETPKVNISPKITIDVPFDIKIVKSNWSLSGELDWSLTDDKDIEISSKVATGFLFSIPTPYITYNLSLTQQYTYNHKYEDIGDAHYYTERISFDFPMPVGIIPHFSQVTLKPYVTATYNWDIDGITHTDLLGPRINTGFSLASGRIDWIENFREGLEFTLNQNLEFNLYKESITPNLDFTTLFFKTGKFFIVDFGFNTRAIINTSIGGELYVTGKNLRGILDRGESSLDDASSENEKEEIKNMRLYNAGITVNIDIPIKIVQTDWSGWFGVNWMHLFDFEMQFSPFIDIALAQSFLDNWYTTGFEILVFPSKMRSIVGRASIGFDLDRFLPAQFINKKNRDAWYELFIGIGLFY